MMKGFKIIHKLNDALEEENRKNRDTIAALQENITYLQGQQFKGPSNIDRRYPDPLQHLHICNNM